MYELEERFASDAASEVAEPSDDITELSVVVPGWQAKALEEAAHNLGLTAGQFMRRLLGQALLRVQRP